MWAKIDKQFSTPPPTWRKQRPLPSPMSERKRSMPTTPVNNKGDLFHIIHKVPAGDSPYVRAKHIQLIEKDPSKAVSMFWAAINAGDRVDSALKDMAVVMKQLDRSDEAIEAIKSFRHLCPYDSQESLDNVLIELYKRSGRIEEEIEMLQHKLKNIEEGVAFGGAKTKMARSQGKKIQITIEQERSRILGNLAWAYLQQNNYEIAEQYYRKALSLEPDKNKQCNLAICLMHMNRMTEAKSLLQAVRISAGNKQMDCSYAKSFERAIQMLTELESSSVLEVSEQKDDNQENQSPFPFPAKGNSNLQVTGSTNGGQNHTSTFYVSRSLENGHDEETPLIKEQDRTAYFQKHHENKNGVFGYDEGSLKCISYGPRRTVFDGRRKGSYRENHACGRSSFANRMKGNCTFSPELGSFLHQKTYAAPAAVRRNLEFQFTQPRKPSRGFSNEEQRKSSQQNIHTDNSVLFTQPRRSSSCGFNIEDQRGGKWGEKSVGSSIRKLTFEQAITAENVPVGALRNVDGVLLISTKDKSEIGSKNSRTPLPSPTNEDWTTRSQKGISQVKDAAVGRRPTQVVVNGDWQGTCWKNEGLVQTKNQAVIEFGTQQISHGIQRMNIWGYGDDQPKFELEESNSSTTSVIVDNAMGAIQSIAAKQKSSQDLLTAKDKKTWADMVEEEERESLSERNLRDCLHGFNMEEEEFNDENLNSNIVYASPCPQNQIDYLSQKLEDSFDVKDDGYVRSKNAAPLSRNLAVRRSLCFDQPQKQELTGHFFSSPLPNKGLKFENRNSAPVKCKDDMSGIRRNRLQVFRDITPFPDSP